MKPAEIYTDARLRLSELARGMSDDDLATRVPACPAWTVKQLFAHLVGGPTDLLNGVFPTAEMHDWTSTHVGARDACTIAELLAEWNELGPRVADAMETSGSRLAILALDVFTHEQDARNAIGKPGQRDTPAADAVLQRFVAGFGQRVRAAGAPAIRVCAGKDEWLLAEGEPTVTLQAEEYDLLRGLIGRRSENQIRAWEWSGEPDPFLPHLSPFPFASSDIAE
jgi:uncharacterized protein (TIGR03083 family)